MLATPLKNMRYQAMKDSAAGCFKDKWMDDAFPNPHQVEMCNQRMENRHMGHFYRNLVDLRESSSYKYQDCMVGAGNNMEKAVWCIRGYLVDIDTDNVTLKQRVESQSGKYFWGKQHMRHDSILSVVNAKIFKHQVQNTL